MEALEGMWKLATPYVYQVLVGAVAIAALLKEWNDYRKLSPKHGKYIPLVLAAVIFVITALSIQETHDSRTAAAEERKAAAERDIRQQTKITDLTEQTRLTREENQKNSEGFRKSFAALYDKFAHLQVRVSNEELLAQIKTTKKELVETQKKLNQPKASLLASFYTSDRRQVPIRRLATKQRDGVLSADLIMYNPGDTPALNGEVIIRICDECKFVKEPPGLVKHAGAVETDRNLVFAHILPRTALPNIPIEFSIPSNPQPRHVEIRVICACDNCVNEDQVLWFDLE